MNLHSLFQRRKTDVKMEETYPQNAPVFNEDISKRAFERGMDFSRNMLYSYKDLNLKKTALDYVIGLVKDDLQSDSCIRLLYHHNGYQPFNLLPLFGVKDSNGDPVTSLIAEHQPFTISHANTHMVSLLHRDNSFFDGIRHVFTQGFCFDSGNHKSIFVPFWNLHIITGGGHHITYVFLHSKAAVDSAVYDITKLFEHVTADGLYWYNAHTKQPILRMMDFRLALLFEWGKWKKNLYHGEDIPMPIFEAPPAPSNEEWIREWEKLTHKYNYIKTAKTCAENELKYAKQRISDLEQELERLKQKINA